MMLVHWPPGPSNDNSTNTTHNPYTVYDDIISIHLWPQPAPGADPHVHVLPSSMPLSALAVATVHRSTYERYRMWEITFYCIYDHLGERSFPAYIDDLSFHPHLLRNWDLRHRSKELFPHLRDLVYRPLHTLFYLSEVMKTASPHVFEHAHRLCFRHLDDNPFNNVAPHLHDLLVRHIQDRQLLLQDGNLACLFAPEGTKWRTILQHYMIRLPHLYAETKKGDKSTVVRWILMTAEKKRHVMAVGADNSGMDCKALLQHYATLLPVYITRQSSAVNQPDRCTEKQTDPIYTELVMAPASAHCLFIDESPRWQPDRQKKKDEGGSQRHRVALPYSETMQFFAQPVPAFLAQELLKVSRSRRCTFLCYTHGSSGSEDEEQSVDESSAVQSQAMADS